MNANQGQLEFVIGKELRELKEYEFNAGMILKKRDKALDADRLRFEKGHPQAGR